jgi:phosphoglycerate kinase
MRWIFKIGVTLIILTAITLLQVGVREFLPFPFNHCNVIFVCLVWLLLFTNSTSVLWLAVPVTLLIELFSPFVATKFPEMDVVIIRENEEDLYAAIIGGAKVSTKLKLLYKLTERADYLILGGGLANTLLFALGYPVGKSLCEKEMVDEVKKIVRHAKDKNTKIMLPRDVLVGTMDGNDSVVKKISEVGASDMILDIGPEAQSDYAKAILASKTLIWNGPVGYMENPEYARGTQFLYYTIAQNPHLVSIVGGGDTLAAIDKMEYLETITHISTGGGAMLEYIENGTLPGIEALK